MIECLYSMFLYGDSDIVSVLCGPSKVIVIECLYCMSP